MSKEVETREDTTQKPLLTEIIDEITLHIKNLPRKIALSLNQIYTYVESSLVDNK